MYILSFLLCFRFYLLYYTPSKLPSNHPFQPSLLLSACVYHFSSRLCSIPSIVCIQLDAFFSLSSILHFTHERIHEDNDKSTSVSKMGCRVGGRGWRREREKERNERKREGRKKGRKEERKKKRKEDDSVQVTVHSSL